MDMQKYTIAVNGTSPPNVYFQNSIVCVSHACVRPEVVETPDIFSMES